MGDRGTGVQTEAYCSMKQQAEAQWKSDEGRKVGWLRYTPCTNVQWIAYLAKVLKYKRYRGQTYKGVNMTRKEKTSLESFMCGSSFVCMGRIPRDCLFDLNIELLNRNRTH